MKLNFLKKIIIKFKWVNIFMNHMKRYTYVCMCVCMYVYIKVKYGKFGGTPPIASHLLYFMADLGLKRLPDYFQVQNRMFVVCYFLCFFINTKKAKILFVG